MGRLKLSAKAIEPLAKRGASLDHGNIVVNVKPLEHFDPEFPLPEYKTSGAVGADLRAGLGKGEKIVIKPGESFGSHGPPWKFLRVLKSKFVQEVAYRQNNIVYSQFPLEPSIGIIEARSK